MITKPALSSQGQCVQKHVQHAWQRLLEMHLPAVPSPSHFHDIRWMARGRWLGPPKICGSGKLIFNGEAAGEVWSWWWADQLLVLAWLLNISQMDPLLSLPETKNQTWTDPCRAALSWKQPGWENNFNKNAITKAYKAVSNAGWHWKVRETSHGSKAVPRIVWRMEKWPCGWSYHWAAASPVITFMVCDLWAL